MRLRIDIGRPSLVFPVTPPCIRVRTRRNEKALRTLTSNAPLFEKLHNHTLKGSYHVTLGNRLENLWESGTHPLKEIAKNERARIRVVLANPDNPQLMVELAYRYALTQDEITSYVRESLTDFKSLLASGCAECYIHVSDRPCLYTYYRLNDVVLLSLFPNTKARTDRPGFILRGAGTLSKFLREDFESYFQSSQAVVKKEKGQDKEKIRERHQQED